VVRGWSSLASEIECSEESRRRRRCPKLFRDGVRNQCFLLTQENERLRFFHFQSHVLFVYLNSCEAPSRPVDYSCACIASSCLGYTRLTLLLSQERTSPFGYLKPRVAGTSTECGMSFAQSKWNCAFAPLSVYTSAHCSQTPKFRTHHTHRDRVSVRAIAQG
jgi:hypothetical protein